MNYWLKIGLVLCAIWAIAAGAIYLARSRKPTAQSVAAYVQANNIDSETGTDRKKTIDRVSNMLNQITMDERQELRREGVTDAFFRSLTPDEQAAFLDATLPTGFRQMMESFNKMDPAKRKEIVDHALAEMRKHQGEQPRDIDQKNVQKIVDQGLRSFYSDANADVKLDLAPLIEQMQQNLQSPR
jgi:hypothetical protein